ncbi:hypothetical protein [Acinetobacter gerneri]|uniref:hypothetical protein n=1 Tax=Acinetobacter gerneri TaxID=202952 RepID=UPI0040384667
MQNVAAGRVTATSTDAVNGSQLNETNSVLGQITADTAAALGTTVNTNTGGLTTPSYAVLTDPNTGATTNVNNVGTAITSLNAAIQKPITFTGDTGTTSNKLNSSFAIVGDTNIATAVTAGQVKVQLKPNISLTSVTTTDGAGNSTVVNATGTKITDTTGNTNTSTSTTNVLKQGTNTLTTSATGTTVTNGTNTTTLNASGVSITNGPSITTSGVNAGNKVISNVLAGSALTDAVNVSQLNAVKANADNLGTTTATALGGGASYNAATGALTAPTYSVVSNPNGVASNVTGVAAALNSLNTAGLCCTKLFVMPYSTI